MHHLSCLDVDKDFNNKNISFYLAKCGEHMTKFYHTSFLNFYYITRLTPLDFLEVHWLNYHILFSYMDADGYYVTYKPITLPCILFVFIEMKFIHCHSCVMFAMKSMSMCND